MAASGTALGLVSPLTRNAFVTVDSSDELDRLAHEGALRLTKHPASAAQFFEQAHALAVGLGRAEQAAALSSLLARSWYARGSMARCLCFAHRAVREAPQSSHSHYTLWRFADEAASLASSAGKPRRAALLRVVADASLKARSALEPES